jgi:hypothetical protein
MHALIDSWFVTMLVALVTVFTFVVAALLPSRALRLRTTHFRCPWVGRMVMVRHLTGDDDEPMSVVSCSAFLDPRAISCGMPCIAGTVGKDLMAAAAGVAARRD